MADVGLQKAADCVADSPEHTRRSGGADDFTLFSGLELIAEALRDGLNDIAAELEQIAEAIRDAGYSG